MANILFFDVDGPMVPGRSLFLSKNIQPRYGWEFDQSAVGMLNFLNFIVPDLQVVIASHRCGMMVPFDQSFSDSRASWQRIFRENGLNLHIHQDWCTMEDSLSERLPKIEEIQQWLNRHPETTNFVTFDDEAAGYDRDPTVEEIKKYHILGQDYLNGITWEDLVQAAKYFGITTRLSQLMDKYRKHLAGKPSKASHVYSHSNLRRIDRLTHPELTLN